MTAFAPDYENDLLARAAQAILARENGAPSTSFLQRVMGIGYARANDLIQLLERRGVISPGNHVGARTITNLTLLQAIADGRDTAPAPEPPTTIRLATADGETLFAGTPEGFADACKSMTTAIETHLRKDRPPMKDDADFRKHNHGAYAVTAEELRQIVEQIELGEAEKRDAAKTVKERYAEAKGRGYDTKALRKIVALRQRKPDELAEEEAVLDLYKTALGMT